MPSDAPPPPDGHPPYWVTPGEGDRRPDPEPSDSAPPPPSGPPTPGPTPPPAGPDPTPPPAGPDPTLDAPGTAPRRLHPASIVIGADPRAIVFAAIGLFSAGPVGLVLAAPVIGIILAAQFLSWQRFRYGFDGTVVRVEQGVLQRRLRSIDVARIQQVELDQPFVHRLLGLAVLRLETASEGGETEVTLPAVTLAEAESLRTRLRAVQRPVAAGTDRLAPSAPHTAEHVLTVGYRDVALAAVTGAQLLALPAAIFVLLDLAGDTGVGDEAGAVAESLASLGLLALVLVVPLGLIAAVVTAVLRDGEVVVERDGDDLRISRGLLSTRQALLPRHRVQHVEVRQNWLRRAFGAASVHVRSAGGGANQDQTRRITVPLVRRGPDLDRLLAALLGDVPADGDLLRHPRRARRRSMVRWTLRLLPLAVAAAAAAVTLAALDLTPGLVIVLAAVLVLAGPPLGAVEYRHLGHAIGTGVVATRHGALGITTGFAPLSRLQGVTQSANPFQRRLALASVDAHLAGTGTTTLTILDVDREGAVTLRRRLTDAAARRTDQEAAT